MAITTLPPSPAGEIDHNTVREKVNEVISEVNGGVERIVTTEYVNASPTIDVEYDTGYNPDPITESTEEISAIALISAGGNQYALFSRASATALVNSPDVRIGRSASFPGVSGSADMTVWYDSVTSTIHMNTNFDGGGKTLDVLQVVSAYDAIVMP